MKTNAAIYEELVITNQSFSPMKKNRKLFWIILIALLTIAIANVIIF